MSRYIDADALIESIENTADLGGWVGEALYQIKQVAVKYIDSAPTIEPKQGKWIKEKRVYGITKPFCSECGEVALSEMINLGSYKTCKSNFCPNCGAKMDGEREGE